LLEATNSWSVHIDNSFLNEVVLIDLKKYFDIIDYKIILRKLSHFGAYQASANWFQSYLSKGTQRCKGRTIRKVMGGVGKKTKKIMQGRMPKKIRAKKEGKEKNSCRRKVQL